MTPAGRKEVTHCNRKPEEHRITLSGSAITNRKTVTVIKGKIIDLWYSGKTHDFGGNIQALFYPSGIPLWVSDVLPGNVHDLAAARENVDRPEFLGGCDLWESWDS